MFLEAHVCVRDMKQPHGSKGTTFISYFRRNKLCFAIEWDVFIWASTRNSLGRWHCGDSDNSLVFGERGAVLGRYVYSMPPFPFFPPGKGQWFSSFTEYFGNNVKKWQPFLSEYWVKQLHQLSLLFWKVTTLTFTTRVSCALLRTVLAATLLWGITVPMLLFQLASKLSTLRLQVLSSWQSWRLNWCSPLVHYQFFIALFLILLINFSWFRFGWTIHWRYDNLYYIPRF